MAKTLRYVTSSDGIYVRSSAAGSIVRSIIEGTLLIYDSTNKPVKKALSGTTYTWIKVTYYYEGPNDAYLETTEATGWVAQENTALVSSDTPSKDFVYSNNKSLSQNKRLANARYIHNYLRSLSSSKRWTSNAICAMLGNMEAESGINPGSWQVLNDTSQGFGLVHWTPATKFINALSPGENKTDIDVQLKRILSEVNDNPKQWESTWHSPTMGFKTFTQSTKTIEVLTEYFVRCYERPKSVDSKVAERQRNALKWNVLLSVVGDI